MSLEELSNFLRSVEHSQSLREKLKNCSNDQSILKLAKDYGFSVQLKDLEDDPISEAIEKWFKTSKIAPIRK